MNHCSMRVLLIAATTFLLAVAAAVAESSLERARDMLKEAPAAPTGYATSKEMQEAIKAGAHPLLGPEDVVIADTVAVERDIPYSESGMKLDLFRPKSVGKPAPGVVYIHGGGWKHKGKDFCTYWAARYAGMGYVCVSIEYRTSDEAIYPAAIEDAKASVRWLRAHAVDYGVDPGRIAAIGQSAGAHLALMLALTAGDAQFEGNGGNADQSSAVQAAVAYYPPTDFSVPDIQRLDVVQQFLGGTSGDVPDRYAQVSPITHVTADDAPILLFHGTIDGLVPVDQSDRLAKKLDTVGVPCVYDRIDGWDHGMDIVKAVNTHCMAVQDRFLEVFLARPGMESK